MLCCGCWFAHQPQFTGTQNRLRPVTNVELLVGLFVVPFNRIQREKKLVGDLLVGQPLRD